MLSMSTHYTIREFSEIVGVTVRTLQRWDREGRLKPPRTLTNRRYYTDEHIKLVLGTRIENRVSKRKTVVYCRVSSRQQSPELKNQIQEMERFCSKEELAVDEWISEYGSGINFKRYKFLSLITRIIAGEVDHLIVAHQDRLMRFGFELMEHICRLSGCTITIANSKYLSPQEEMIEDLMAIIDIFSGRLYGLLGYKKKIKAAAEGKNSKST